jgi:hypothetical protein
LTTSLQLCQKSTASRAPASQATSSRIAGRHHLGISGRLRRNLHPGDWFRPGSYELLEQYCEFTVQQRRAIETLRKAEGEDYGPALAATKSLTTMLTALASKLRLSVQADVDRRAVGKAAERGDGTRDPLLGGAAVWGEHVQ